MLPRRHRNANRVSGPMWQPRRDPSRTARPARLVRPLLTGVLFVALGCGDEAPVEPPAPVATTLTVSPASSTMQALDDTVRLSATVLDQDGRVMAAAVVEWSSSDEAVAVVDGAGLVTATGNGTATVTAGNGGVVGEAVVTVAQVVAEVRVVPDSVAFAAIGDTARLVAEAVDANGHGVAGAAVEWSSSDTAVVVVDSAGLMTAVGNGTVRVTAENGGVMGEVVVTVEQVVAEVRVAPDSVAFAAIGDTARIAAEALDANGHGVGGATVEWSSGDTVVAVVDSAGLVTAVGNGTATVTAGSGGVVGEAVVTVEQVVAGVRVVPDSVTFAAIGDTTRLVAEALDANGHGVAGAAVEWSSGDTAVAVVDNAGLVTTVGNGTAAVTAGSGGVVGEAVVTVEQVVAEVRVVPDSVTFAAIGDTVRLVAEAVDTNGHVVDGIDFEWSSSDEAVAVVDSAGLVTAVGNGTATVTAASGGVVGQASVLLDGQREILRILYEATDGPMWVRKDHWLTAAPLDDWYGISTDRLGNVEAIWLQDNGLHGVLPPEVGGLTELRYLSLGSAGSRIGICSDGAPHEYVVGPPRYHSAVEATIDPPSEKAVAGLRHPSEALLPRDMLRADVHSLPDVTDGLRWSNSTAASPNRISGPIPPELGKLVKLETLDLEGNAFSGPIPFDFGQLVGLKYLSLSKNRLSASIPPQIGNLTALKTLDLSQNTLTGPIPPELGALIELRALRLFSNAFDSELPPEIGQLTALRSLVAFCARLSGSIPSELGNLASLEELHLADNLFVGHIPLELGRLANLTKLWLFENQLSGQIPPELGNLVSLRVLHLADNLLVGQIPSELAKLANLEELALYENQLSGPIPPVLRSLSKLNLLLLAKNQLVGYIPAGLSSLANLYGLWLGGNQLSGPIPPEFGHLTNLRSLHLDNNRLSGRIPPELGGLANLRELWLGVNRLSGAIPPELGRLASLSQLLLFRNQLAGPIPPEFGRLTNLSTLWLHESSLSGPIPLELTNLQQLGSFLWHGTDLCVPRNHRFRAWLAVISDARGPADRACPALPTEVLEVFHNATGGAGWRNSANWLTEAPLASWHGITVEDSLVTALDLSDNNLTGTLPPEIGEFVDMKRVDLSDNGLSDAIPAAVGDLEHLESLDLSNNGFTGLIARSIGSLDSLRDLDLSGNEMSGALPSSFAELGRAGGAALERERRLRSRGGVVPIVAVSGGDTRGPHVRCTVRPFDPGRAPHPGHPDHGWHGADHRGAASPAPSLRDGRPCERPSAGRARHPAGWEWSALHGPHDAGIVPRGARCRCR